MSEHQRTWGALIATMLYERDLRNDPSTCHVCNTPMVGHPAHHTDEQCRVYVEGFMERLRGHRMGLSGHEYGLYAIKRRWCPEWLWWFACNPLPFWNEAMPYYRFSLRPLVWLLQEVVEYDADGVPIKPWIRERLGRHD